MKLVLDLAPQRGACETAFHRLLDHTLFPKTIHPETIRHIVEDRFRKWIGLLKDHADAATNVRHVQMQQILAIQQKLAVHARIA